MAFARPRAALVDDLVRRRFIRTQAVERAFRAVPRHLFLPQTDAALVYRDEAIPIKFDGDVAISSSSQPAIMAEMLEQLDVRDGAAVLEVGAGTGYNAALLAYLVGSAGRVASVELDAELAFAARDHVIGAGFSNVHVECGDGTSGYEPWAPYDRVILTVASSHIAEAWRTQLRDDGRLVMPLALRGAQKLVTFVAADRCLQSVAVSDCGFVALRGREAEDEVVRLSLQTLSRWGRPATKPSLRVGEAVAGLGLWIALHSKNFCRFECRERDKGFARAPSVFDFQIAGRAVKASYGVCASHGAAILSCGELDRSRLEIRAYGRAGELADELSQVLDLWDRAGRPTTQRLGIRAVFRDEPQFGERLRGADAVVERRAMTFGVWWDGIPSR